MLSKGDIVYYISYLGHKLERDDFAENKGVGGHRMQSSVFFFGPGKLEVKRCNLCHPPPFLQPRVTFSTPAPTKGHVSPVAGPHPPHPGLRRPGSSKTQQRETCRATFLILLRG